jgi:hypothetical protein
MVFETLMLTCQTSQCHYPKGNELFRTLRRFYSYQPQCGTMYDAFFLVRGKGKAVPLQAWSGPEGSRKLRFPDFMTTAQDGGKVSLTHRLPLPLGNTPGTHFC